MSVNSKMTAIADPVRTLMGSSGKIGLDAMANHLGNAVAEVDNQNGIIQELKAAIAENVSKTSNEVSEQIELIQQIKGAINENVGKTTAEVETQTDLIQQIKTALEGKAGGGGTVLPTLTNPGTAEDLAEGKELIDAEGKVVTGVMPKALTIKSGTTTSRTIDTGLSEIEEFFIYKETQTGTGLIHLHYSKTGGTSYMYASAWSTNNYGTKTITNATTAPTISGGSITLPSSTATSGGLSSGVTYKWTAIGTE